MQPTPESGFGPPGPSRPPVQPGRPGAPGFGAPQGYGPPPQGSGGPQGPIPQPGTVPPPGYVPAQGYSTPPDYGTPPPGYGPQGAPPSGPPSGPPKPGRRRMLWAAVGGGVVLVGGGTAAAIALTGGDKKHPVPPPQAGGSASAVGSPSAPATSGAPAGNGSAPAPLWRIELNRPSDEAPVLAGGQVIVKANLTKDATEVADLQAYDQTKGTRTWTYPGVAALDVTHVRVAGSRIVMREEMGGALVLDPTTGQKTGELGTSGNDPVMILVVETTNGSVVYVWGSLTPPGGDPLANSDKAVIAAYDAESDKKLWSQPGIGTLANVQATYVAGQGSLVFSVDVANHVIGRDPVTGKPLWDVNIGPEPSLGALGAPFYAVSEPLGLFFTTRRKTVAWDARTGTKRWGIEPASSANHFGRSVLSPDGRTLFTSELGSNSAVLAVDAATGRIRWRVSPGALTPDGLIYLCGPDLLAVPAATGADGFWALNTADGSLRWHYQEPGTGAAPWYVAGSDTATVVAALQGNTLVALPLR